MITQIELDALRGDLASDNDARQLSAAEKLLTHPGFASELAPELLLLCATSNDALREVVVGALEGMGPPQLAIAPQVTPFLQGNELQAYWSATLLGRLGAKGAPAGAALIKALTEGGSIAVKERAAWALGQIGPAAVEALPALEAAAASESRRLARFAKEAIGSIGDR